MSGELVVDHVHRLEQKTVSPIPVASAHGVLYLAVTGLSSTGLYGWSPGAHGFQYVSAGPAMASAMAGNDHDLFYVVHDRMSGSRLEPGAQRVEHSQSLMQHYPSAPAATMWGDRRVAVFTVGRQHRVEVAVVGDGAFWPVVLLGNSPYRGADFNYLGLYRVAATTVGSELFVAWINRHVLEVAWTHQGTFGPPVTIPDVRGLTDICGLGDELAVCWVAGKTLSIGFLRGGQLVPALRRPLARQFPPGRPHVNGIRLCVHGGYLVATWPGSDRYVDVAWLRRAG